jgi:hypothetical protein
VLGHEWGDCLSYRSVPAHLRRYLTMEVCGCPWLTGRNSTWTTRPVGGGDPLRGDVGARLADRPTLLLPVPSSCPACSSRAGPTGWLWRRGTAGGPGRGAAAAGGRVTQRQRAGYELDTAPPAHAALGAQLPAVRVVITHRPQVPVYRLVSQTTPTKYAQVATSAVTASQVTGTREDCLGHSIASWDSRPCTRRSVGGKHPEAVSCEGEACRSSSSQARYSSITTDPGRLGEFDLDVEVEELP